MSGYNTNKSVSYAQQFMINTEPYAATNVTLSDFSIMAYNCLMRNRIFNIKMLLDKTPDEISALSGSNSAIINEIEKLVQKLANFIPEAEKVDEVEEKSDFIDIQNSDSVDNNFRLDTSNDGSDDEFYYEDNFNNNNSENSTEELDVEFELLCNTSESEKESDNSNISYNSYLSEDGISYAEQFSIDPQFFHDASIESCEFSHRTFNCLMRAGINTIEELLRKTPAEILSIKNLGKKSLDETENLIKNLAANSPVSVIYHFPKTNNCSFIKTHSTEILAGDFTFADESDLSDSELQLVEKYKQAYQTTDEELVYDAVFDQERIYPIVLALNEFVSVTERNVKLCKKLDSVPRERCYRKAIPYIDAFTFEDNQRKILKSFCSSEDTTIAEMILCCNIETVQHFYLLENFLEWCTFNIEEQTDQLFKDHLSDREQKVVFMRAKKQTLEEIGAEFDVTRERIRQIETKAIRKFNVRYRFTRIIAEISAEKNGVDLITRSDIENYCGKNAQSLMHLLISCRAPDYIYNKTIDSFIVGNSSTPERIQNLLDSLPDVVKEDDKQNAFDAAEAEGVSAEVFEKAFNDTFMSQGSVYSRCRLSLTSIYKSVLDKYYQNGIYPYISEEIIKFKELVKAEFGDIKLPDNDRAITGRITDIAILCGRGCYRPKKDKYIPKTLANAIYNYIMNHENPVFLTNTIFNVFEDELRSNGIDNKYYLQGILHELFDDKLTFRRDYISKDPNITSVYSSIVEYIKKAETPISKQDIAAAFPGITEVVIMFAAENEKVLNYFGEYWHSDRLIISDREKEYLYNTITTILKDGKAHHIKEIYSILLNDIGELFTRNYALTAFSAFSVLENLFRDKFSFRRPQFAPKGVEIELAGERLHDYIYSHEEISLDKIKKFAAENFFSIYSLLELMDECNDEYLITNSNTIMRISKIGITQEVVQNIEDLLTTEVSGTMPISQLTIWNSLPPINVQWSEWLIYSAINKWGEKFEVAPSSPTLSSAVPLIAPTGQMNSSAFASIKPNSNSVICKVDDLDNIDALIEDMIDDDFMEEI